MLDNFPRDDKLTVFIMAHPVVVYSILALLEAVLALWWLMAR